MSWRTKRQGCKGWATGPGDSRSGTWGGGLTAWGSALWEGRVGQLGTPGLVGVEGRWSRV